MFDVRSAFNKQRAFKEDVRVEALSKCATDYAGTLMFQSLHDVFDFGTKRLADVAEMFETLGDNEKGFIHEWKDEITRKGVHYPTLEKMSIDLAKYICRAKENRQHIQTVANLCAASFIVILYCVSKRFGFGEKRLKMLLEHTKNEIYVVRKLEVSMMEFMECLNVECNVYNEILDEYKKQNNIKSIPIYGEAGTKWIRKEVG